MSETTNMKMHHARPLIEAKDEIERELNVRARCFPRWVEDGRVSHTDATDRLDRLASALYYLEALQAAAPDDTAEQVCAAAAEEANEAAEQPITKNQ